MHREIYCYRYIPGLHHYDDEAIWQFVQRHQGHISIRAAGIIDFYIPCRYHSLFVLAYPGLKRKPQQDYV